MSQRSAGSCTRSNAFPVYAGLQNPWGCLCIRNAYLQKLYLTLPAVYKYIIYVFVNDEGAQWSGQWSYICTNIYIVYILYKESGMLVLLSTLFFFQALTTFLKAVHLIFGIKVRKIKKLPSNSFFGQNRPNFLCSMFIQGPTFIIFCQIIHALR